MEISRLFDFLKYQLKNHSREDSIVMKNQGEWQKISTEEFANKANMVSRGFLKLGIQHGDKVAIASTTNRTEWNILDIGLQQIGCISVPVYPTISPSDYEYIFNDSEVKLVFVSDADLYEKVSSIKEKVPSLVSVYTFDKVEGAAHW